MSTWQSFFNQLSKPVNTNSDLTILNKICCCDKGSLLSCGSNTYRPQGDCSLSSVCCAIQIDKHRAYTFNTNSTISKKPEIQISEKNSSKLLAIDASKSYSW